MKKEKSTLTFKTENPFALQGTNYVGGYRLGGVTGLQINLTYKPNWFHRTMMKLCLGWEWVNL